MRWLVALMAAVAGLLVASSAAGADSTACGNIDVTAGAQCAAVVEPGAGWPRACINPAP